MSNGRDLVRKTGMWRIGCGDREPADVNGQISEILGRMTSDLAIWRCLSNDFKIEIFCGLLMEELNEGLSLSAPLLKALGERGIEIGFDVYAPAREIIDEPVP